MRRVQVVRVETYELTSFSGGDVVRRLRARGTALPPIILISAHPDLPVIARLHIASSRDIFGCSKNRQNRIVENSTYPLDDFGFR